MIKSRTGKKKTSKIALASFAGGCFWCVESAFITYRGVLHVSSGFMGEDSKKPTYEEVATGQTTFFEAVQFSYDSQLVSYAELLTQFWRQIDPTDPGGQFADRGPQYQTAIFYHTPEQKKLATHSKKELELSGKFSKPIVTMILPASHFFTAPEYHQAYALKHPLAYKLYKNGSGRQHFIDTNWES